MGKMTTLTIVIAGLSLLFFFSGLTSDVPSFTTLLLYPENIGVSGLAVAITAAIALAATVGAIRLGFISLNIELALMATVSLIMLNFLWEIINIYQLISDTINPVISILLFSPIIVIIAITIIDWMRGRDQ